MKIAGLIFAAFAALSHTSAPGFAQGKSKVDTLKMAPKFYD